MEDKNSLKLPEENGHTRYEITFESGEKNDIIYNTNRNDS
jgi:hypothetical protein